MNILPFGRVYTTILKGYIIIFQGVYVLLLWSICMFLEIWINDNLQPMCTYIFFSQVTLTLTEYYTRFQ
jgi:hypothetical protein